MTSVIVIQARTTSSRLPAKVLLPIAGMPLVILAAKRAENTGRKLIVAISNESSDDYLTDIIRAYNLNYFRGSLDNVLSRFVHALEGYDGDTIVFRLTADNVFPDGQLLDEIEQDFKDRSLEYICCNGINSGLPYGVSVEATRIRHLRQALNNNPSAHDLEHVTPAIIRELGASYFDKYINYKMGQYRCTIDCLDDYLTVSSLFENVQAPIQESAFSLINKLKVKRTLQPASEESIGKLVFGTAQLGMDYGIANISGKPSAADTEILLKTAVENGVEFFDTARAYGDSESAIRRAMALGWQGRAKVITKLSPLDGLPVHANLATCNAFVDASLYESLNALGLEQVDVLLLHRAEHINACDGKIWNRLLVLQEQGKIKSLGVSIQTPNEMLIALDFPQIKYIQLPLNILDWRWQKLSEKILAVKKERELNIHTRSVYLQGLLISDNQAHWKNANVMSPKEIQTWLFNTARSFERSSVKDLCLAFINGLSWVDGIVIGMETLNQLYENLALLAKPPLDSAQLAEIYRTRPRLNQSSLNPSMWDRKSI